MTVDALIEAGWQRTRSGRWHHPDLKTEANGRRRMFSEGQALTLQQASCDAESTDIDASGYDESNERAEAPHLTTGDA